jgi:hypothetical protein
VNHMNSRFRRTIIGSAIGATVAAASLLLAPPISSAQTPTTTTYVPVQPRISGTLFVPSNTLYAGDTAQIEFLVNGFDTPGVHYLVLTTPEEFSVSSVDHCIRNWVSGSPALCGNAGTQTSIRLDRLNGQLHYTIKVTGTVLRRPANGILNFNGTVYNEDEAIVADTWAQVAVGVPIRYIQKTPIRIRGPIFVPGPISR